MKSWFAPLILAAMQCFTQPSADEVRKYPQLHISKHPVVRHKLSLLRHKETAEKEFEELIAEISWLLGYEAMADLSTKPFQINTPLEPMEGSQLTDKIALIPILRAGLGMAGGFRQLVPSARVWHLGMYRHEETLCAIEYYNKLPRITDRHVCFILDPMLASGGQAVRAIEILKALGAEAICFVGLIAAPYGVKQIVDRHPDVKIFVAALDRCLNERGYILPGLGDAGDRQFDRGS